MTLHSEEEAQKKFETKQIVYGSTDGGDVINLLGDNFGPNDRYLDRELKLSRDQVAVVVTYGPTGSEYHCTDSTITHTSISCRMGPGVGEKLYWKVYVHDQNSSVSEWWTSYEPPVLESLCTIKMEEDLNNVPCGVNDEVKTDGSDTLRVWGRGFGVSDPDAIIRVSFDGKDSQVRYLDRKPSMGIKKVGDRRYNYIDVLIPPGQGMGKLMTLSVEDSIGNIRSTDTVAVDYGSPVIRGVNIYEGRTKDERTLFVYGKNFGRSSILGKVRVSQKRSDFDLKLRPPVRNGGSRSQILTGCKNHKAEIEGIAADSFTIRHCVHEDNGLCIKFNPSISVPKSAVVKVEPKVGELVDVVANQEMCAVTRFGKTSCLWKANSCFPDWGVTQRVNQSAGDWGHNGVEFQFSGDFIIDPDCAEEPCELIIEGIVELEVSEIPAVGVKLDELPSPQVSNLMHFISYSPQIWSVAIGQTLETAVVGPEFADANITSTAYYRSICGEMSNSSGRLGVRLSKTGERQQIFNNFCGPCVGKRSCVALRTEMIGKFGQGCGNSSDCSLIPVGAHISNNMNNLFYRTSGGEVVVLYGRYMSEDMKVSVGPQNPEDGLKETKKVTIKPISFPNKVFMIKFEMPPGQGRNQELQIIRGSQASRPIYVHYKPPRITKVCLLKYGSGEDGSEVRANLSYGQKDIPGQDGEEFCASTSQLQKLSNLIMNTTGGTVRIYGTNLGIKRPGNALVSKTLRVKDIRCRWLDDERPWSNKCEDKDYQERVGPTKCDKNHKAGMRMQCRIPPQQGAKHIVQVSIGNQLSNTFVLGFKKPQIEKLEWGNSNDDPTSEHGAIPTDPISETLTITGRNFGVLRRHEGHKNADGDHILSGRHKIMIGVHQCIVKCNSTGSDNQNCYLREETVSSSAKITCILPVGQGSKNLILNISGQVDERQIFYKTPRVVNATIKRCASDQNDCC
jgi:hypothetical protein